MSMNPSKARTCCCCLPIRIGVALIALGGAVVGVGFAVVGILIANKLDSQLAFDAKLSLQLHVFVYVLFAIFSILGIISALNRSKNLAIFHFSSYAAHLPFSIASGTFLLCILFSMKGRQILTMCTEASGGSVTKGVFFTKDLCNQNISVLRGIIVGILVFVWLCQLSACMVLNSYVKELAPPIYKPDYVISP